MAQKGVCAYIHLRARAQQNARCGKHFFYKIDLNHAISHFSCYIYTKWVIEINFMSFFNKRPKQCKKKKLEEFTSKQSIRKTGHFVDRAS